MAADSILREVRIGEEVQLSKLMIWASLFGNRLFCARSFAPLIKRVGGVWSSLANLLETATVDPSRLKLPFVIGG